MALTAAQLTRVRQLASEPTTDTFSDQDIQDTADFMSRVPDSDGNPPSHADYTATYDLYLLAAELWRLKAGFVADEFDFSSEGAEFQRSQKYEMYLGQAKRYSDMSMYRSSLTAID